MPKSYERAPASAPTFRITIRHHAATNADASECSEKNSKSIRGGGTPRFARRGRHSRHRCLPRSAWATFGCAKSSYWHLRCQVLNHLFGGSKLLFLATFPQPACCRQYKASDHMTFFANKLFCHAAFCKQPRPIYRARALRLYSHENALKQRNIGNVFNAFFLQNMRI